MLEQVEEKRRRDVVGQVAHDPQSSAPLAGELGEVEFQRVDLVEYEAWIFVYLGAQQCDQIAVNLECIERAVAGFEQQAGECSTAWPNFHEAIVRAGPDRRDDVFQDRGIVQEMLAKPLATRWLTQAGLGTHWEASSIARLIAEARLLGSARPVPARSSAVPWSTDVRRIGNPRVMLTAVSKPACLITGRPWS